MQRETHVEANRRVALCCLSTVLASAQACKRRERRRGWIGNSSILIGRRDNCWVPCLRPKRATLLMEQRLLGMHPLEASKSHAQDMSRRPCKTFWVHVVEHELMTMPRRLEVKVHLLASTRLGRTAIGIWRSIDAFLCRHIDTVCCESSLDPVWG